jgi:iron complex transport system ATP-binding protein
MTITARNVSFAYRDSVVLHSVDAQASNGEVVGLIGPNGSGKTTMLRTLYGALRPTGGSVTVDGVEVSAMKPTHIARRIMVVPQEGTPELPLAVAEMVLLGRAPLTSMFRSYSREDHRLAAAALQRVGARQLADRAFDTLSGGEKQRVLIARALTQGSDHLLLDEPTNHLDVRYQHELLALIGQLQVTTVVVLHDLNLAARYCDRLILLEAGRVVATGTPEEVLDPAVLEPVYGVNVRRIEEPDSVQLVFSPRSPDNAARKAALPC